jgi:hypothetical protein
MEFKNIVTGVVFTITDTEHQRVLKANKDFVVVEKVEKEPVVEPTQEKKPRKKA